MSKFQRSSGLILHPTSLPGPYGIGELNKHAYEWIDFLVEAKQSIWQVLPLGPTGYGNSPYQTISVFAGNPLLIDLDWLLGREYISRDELEDRPEFSNRQVLYERVIDWKTAIILKAHKRFLKNREDVEWMEYQAFCQQNDDLWLDDFALFVSIKNYHDGISWQNWPEALKCRDSRALSKWRNKLADEISAHKFLQFVFFKQWSALKAYANERNIRILGDIPIYVTYDSADVWANQALFLLDENGDPTAVAGVPPDYFSETGQLWGNPIYNWAEMKKNNFAWWIDRVRIALQQADMVRIDHFRGFEAYWSVPYGESTAVNGEWVKGPGTAFFKVLMAAFDDMPVIAEDLGLITDKVEVLRDRFEFPGMKILQFAFGDGADNEYLPHNYLENCVVYTGSHDNDTTAGWFRSLDPEVRKECLEYIGKYHGDISFNLIRLASASVAVMAIFPVQDVLGLDSSARMNTPGVAYGNWTWRLQPGELGSVYSTKLARITTLYGRVPAESNADSENHSDHD